MANWKKILREDLAVGAGLITQTAAGSANSVTLTLSDSADTPNTDVITIGIGDNLTASAITDGGFTLDVTGLAAVATSGDYTDLTNAPTIGDGAITFTGDAYITPTGDFTLNQEGAQAISFAHATIDQVPTSDNAVPAFGESFAAVSGVSVNGAGHVTGIETTTYTLPTPDAAFISSVNNTAGQTGINLSVSGGQLTATAPNLSTSSDVTFANLVVSGDLTVNGDTTQLNVTNLNVEDKIIKLADVTTPSVTTGNLSGIQVEVSTTEAEWPELIWDKDGVLTGWTLSDYTATSNKDLPVAVMEFAAAAPSASDEAAGAGSFYFDTDANILYVDVQ